MTELTRRPGGASVAGRPAVYCAPDSDSAVDLLREAARSYREFADAAGPLLAGRIDSWCASFGENAAHARVFRDAHRTDPKLAARLAEGAATLPQVGDDFCGFKLVAELGRGAFGRVFLSHQGDLADRPVALKVAADVGDEPQRLARLQHTNIVPVYSFHRRGPLQAVCMPYFGSATLADVASELSRRESLPDSGRVVASAVYDRRSRTLCAADSRTATPSGRGPAADTPADARPAPSPAPATQELKRLEGLTYVEAILWIGARLADGLAHAHDRGILHRDLKPANVLLTDDGQPMLLDFNLSEDRGRGPAAAVAQIGGTLPYMAPEHLEAFGGTWRDVDARCDLFSVGVILFELLTGRAPYPRPAGAPDAILPRMIADRRKGPPSLRRYNRAVSPAAEAIVCKCLEADPDRRYQTARDLRDDLERHLADLPLLHQPEPSRRERLGKWVRRNRWVRSTGAVTAAAAVLIAALATAVFAYKERSLSQEALVRLQEFRADRQAAQSLLYARETDPGGEEEGRAAARRALDRYGVLEGNWLLRPAVLRLPAEERERLPADAGQLLVLLAASLVPDSGATPEQRAEALRLNRLAEDCFPADRLPRALLAQRAALVDDDAEAARLRERAAATPPTESWDHYLTARALLREDKFVDAVAEAREAVRIDPESYAAWFLLGNCYLEGHDEEDHDSRVEAAAYFTTCVSLRPEFFAAYYYRGRAYYHVHEYERAAADFARAVARKSGFAEADFWRARSLEKAGKCAEALTAINRNIAEGGATVRAYLVRARLNKQLGDVKAAASDQDAVSRLKPAVCYDWILRGLSRVESGDYDGALSDFVEASHSDPRSRWALMDQAHVLAERLNRPDEAIRVLDRLLKLYPNQPVIVCARGVYKARVGRRAEAIADARRAVQMAPQAGEVLFRAACAYSLTSRLPDDEKGDRRKAVHYLYESLKRGFGYDNVARQPGDEDKDLVHLKDDPEFQFLRNLAVKAKQSDGQTDDDGWQ